MPIQDNPLTKSQYNAINAALGDIIRFRELMAKAKACGIDVSEYQTYFDAQEAKFNEMKAQFFQNLS